jgi:S-adenosylmethionine hydrolase
MSDPIITLTTDFGEESAYVAAMKGVILSTNPAARILDLSHLIPPQDAWHAAFFLAEAIPFFPPQAIHVVVVDPGVGTERAVLYVEIESHQLLVPDNGVITLLARNRSATCRRVAEPRYWRPTVSATFHGRDIFAPIAAHLSLGVTPQQLGPSVTDWVQLSLPTPIFQHDGIAGEVLFVDHFGNLLTNLPVDRLPRQAFRLGIETVAGLPAREVQVRPVRTYGEGRAGELLALVSSGGFWEFALPNGNAARRFGVRRGTHLKVINAA